MIKIIFFFFLVSCALVPQRDRERKIQTQIISSLSQQSGELAKCVKSSNLFEKFNTNRLRLTLYLTINSDGLINKFKLDEKPYPTVFSECVFNKIDKISYADIKENELIELEQPFIFSKE